MIVEPGTALSPVGVVETEMTLVCPDLTGGRRGWWRQSQITVRRGGWIWTNVNAETGTRKWNGGQGNFGEEEASSLALEEEEPWGSGKTGMAGPPGPRG